MSHSSRHTQLPGLPFAQIGRILSPNDRKISIQRADRAGDLPAREAHRSDRGSQEERLCQGLRVPVI